MSHSNTHKACDWLSVRAGELYPGACLCLKWLIQYNSAPFPSEVENHMQAAKVRRWQSKAEPPVFYTLVDLQGAE
jgi:hypothetical protein